MSKRGSPTILKNPDSGLPNRSDLATPNGDISKWCYRDGNLVYADDIKYLCDSIPDDFVIQRAKHTDHIEYPNPDTKPSRLGKDGVCVCQDWSYETAHFKVCNCDKCDALIIPHGLKDKCKTLVEECTDKGYASGYIKHDHGLYEQYSTPKMSPKQGDWHNYTGTDPRIQEETEKVECASGNEFRVFQDYTGPALKCGIKGWTGKGCLQYDGKTPEGGWQWVWDNSKKSRRWEMII
jgi:hypothetical protein